MFRRQYLFCKHSYSALGSVIIYMEIREYLPPTISWRWFNRIRQHGAKCYAVVHYMFCFLPLYGSSSVFS